jgi:hypothetical protein
VVEDDVCSSGDGGGGGFKTRASSPPMQRNRDGAGEVAKREREEGV